MSLCPVDHKACQCAATRADPCLAVEAMRSELELLRADSERLRRVLSVVRHYPDFDSGGPLAEAMDQALAGKSPELLEVLERLVAVGVEGPNAEFSGGPAGPSHTTGRP